jgi:Excreted virulence factor EspC, type VII ESX diderm
MSETLSSTVSALRRAGENLADAGDRLRVVEPGADAFGAGRPGQLGELGQDLYRQWQGALDARVREATAHAARLHDAADAVSTAAGAYRDVDDTAHRYHQEVT